MDLKSIFVDPPKNQKTRNPTRVKSKSPKPDPRGKKLTSYILYDKHIVFIAQECALKAPDCFRTKTNLDSFFEELVMMMISLGKTRKKMKGANSFVFID